jgi:hypothetical protein
MLIKEKNPLLNEQDQQDQSAVALPLAGSQDQAAAPSVAVAQDQAQAVALPSDSMPPPAPRPPNDQVVLSQATVRQIFSPQSEKISSLIKKIVTLAHGNFQPGTRLSMALLTTEDGTKLVS